MTEEEIAAQEQFRPLRQLEADFEVVRSTAADLEQQARAFIQQQPVAAVLAAAGLGYLIARLASRLPR